MKKYRSFLFFAVYHLDTFGGGTKLNLCCWKVQFNTANLWTDRCLIHTKGLIKVKLSERSWIFCFKMYFQMRLFYLFYHVSFVKALLTRYFFSSDRQHHDTYGLQLKQPQRYRGHEHFFDDAKKLHSGKHEEICQICSFLEHSCMKSAIKEQ